MTNINNKYDLIIKNGTIIDGTGKKSYKADIGIIDGKIAKIGVLNKDALKIVDANKLMVTPGF